MVAAVDGIHAGLPHAFEHEGVTGGDGEQGQQVDGQEAVDDEGSLEAGRGEDLAAVRLRTKPVSSLQTLVHGDRDRQKQGAWRRQGTQLNDSEQVVHHRLTNQNRSQKTDSKAKSPNALKNQVRKISPQQYVASLLIITFDHLMCESMMSSVPLRRY